MPRWTWTSVLFLAACRQSPASICDHVFELSVSEYVAAGNEKPDDAKADEAKQHCMTWLDERKAKYSEENFAQLGECLGDTKDVAATDVCRGRAHDASLGYDTDVLTRELGELGATLAPTLVELRRLDGELLAASKAMGDDPEHKLEHFGTMRLRCADIGKTLDALVLDAGAYTQEPVQRVAAGLLRGRDAFTRSQKTCGGFECPAACAEAWNNLINETQLAELKAKPYGVVIAPIRAATGE